MADSSASPGASQKTGSSQHQRIVLQKQLAEVRMENTILRQQLYQVSTLLDIAVSKLGTLGVSLETPIDIRALRAAALQYAYSETSQAQEDTIGASPKAGDLSSGHNTNKKFQMRQQLCEHNKAVQCCAFSDRAEPLIATGGMDCRLIVHNHFTGEKLWDAMAHEEAVSDVAWFDDHYLLSASYDSMVKLWDVNGSSSNKSVLYQYSAHGFVLSAIPLSSSLFACSDSQHRTAIVDVRVGGKGLVQEHDNRVNSLSYDESAMQLLMGQSNGVVSIWDLRRPDQALQTTTSSGTGVVAPLVAVSPRGGGIGTNATDAPIAGAADVGDAQGANSKGTVGDDTPTGTVEEVSNAGVPISGGSAAAQASTSGLGNGGSAATAGLLVGSTRMTRTMELENELSHAPISYIAHFHSDDDTRRLICVSGDNMVRLYRGNLNAFTAGRTDGANLYVLRNVMTGIPTRGNVMRSGFWKGERAGKSEVSVFFDDGEMDTVARPPRRLTECDVLVTGGPDNTAQVFDVTDEGNVVVLERLEGHRDRVTGATVRRSRKPIIATTSADSTTVRHDTPPAESLMPSFAGSQLSVVDITAFHTAYHDTMHGTFAEDKHHNLPRPLRSYPTGESRNISVRSSAAAAPLPPTASSSSSVFHTAQWNEFGDCVRELSPFAERGERSDEEEEERRDSSDATYEEERKLSKGRNDEVVNSSADRSVVDRLAELSQSRAVDPVAVAAALREAEKMLQPPARREARSNIMEQRQRSPIDHVLTHRHSYDDNKTLESDRQRCSQPAEGMEYSSRDDEADHRRHNADQAHQQRRELHTAPQEEMYSADARHPPWAWPRNTRASVEAAVHQSHSSPTSNHWAPLNYMPNTFVPNAVPPCAVVGDENTRDAAMHWYKVYYAWMLYYQQLYATQILQYERYQRHAQRRKARREKGERRADQIGQESGLWPEQDDASNACRSRHNRAAQGRAVDDVRNRRTTVEDAARQQHSPRCHGENSTAQLRRHASDAARKYEKSTTAANNKYEEEESMRGRSADINRSDAQQLRAQLQALEEKFAALSTLVTEDDIPRPSHNTSHRNSPHPVKMRVEGSSPRAYSRGKRRSPEKKPNFTAVPMESTNTATAATWQALSERQRSRSGVSRDRGRRVFPQRPQWR